MKNTPEKKQIALWLDHEKAYLINPREAKSSFDTIHAQRETKSPGEESGGTRLGNHRASNNEHHLHQREQNFTASYYKKIKERLETCDEVLLLGPGTAKKELRNLLMEDPAFRQMMITEKSADSMSEAQLRALVKQHFEKNKSLSAAE
jgi:hypothetical protein